MKQPSEKVTLEGRLRKLLRLGVAAGKPITELRNGISGVATMLGIMAACVLFASSNVLASRFFRRWDVTPDALYSLSPATLEVLGGLDAPVEIIVLLGRGDPLTPSVRYLLDAYQAQSQQLRTRFVDPDRSPAEFLATQKEYGLLDGRTEEGRAAEDASIVVVSGRRHWFVTTNDIVAYDDETGAAKPRLEQVLTEALAQVRSAPLLELCVLKGHGELGWQAAGPQGLEDFRARLQRNNFALREVELSETGEHSLEKCDAALSVGPGRPFGERAVAELVRAFDQGVNLLFALGPIVGDDGRVLDPGLGRLLSPLGVSPARDVVFERDEALSMPIGVGGEVFLATPQAHPITLSMLHGEEVQMRVLFQLAQSFEIAKTSSARPLLVSGNTSVALNDFRQLKAADWGKGGDTEVKAGARVVAVALEQVTETSGRKVRLTLVGSSSLFWSSTFREPALLGTRRFVENLVAWLTSRRSLVSVPEKAEHPAGVALTEEALGEVQRYVLLYMPGCAGLIGILILLRRRDTGARPRTSTKGSSGSKGDETEQHSGETE